LIVATMAGAIAAGHYFNERGVYARGTVISNDLIDGLEAKQVLADKAYDPNSLREEDRGAERNRRHSAAPPSQAATRL
jgi:hypothetical protein